MDNLGDFDSIGKENKMPSVISPWRQIVPLERTCKDANIKDIYCVCNGVVGIDPKRGWHHWYPAKELAKELINILPEPKCDKLIYNITTEAQVDLIVSNLITNLT